MRRVVWILALAGLGYALVCGAVYAFQRKLLYFPQMAPPQQAAPAGAEEVRVETADELSLTGWWWPADGAALLVFGGNASNRMSNRILAEELHARLGVAVLLADYRGYGGNPGSPSEEGLYTDAEAWQAWLAARAQGPLVYLGTSLGSGVAVELAVRRAPAALVLQSPFTSVVDVGAEAYPLLPVRLLQRDRFESEDKVGALDCPLLVLHGTADDLVPPAHGRALVAAAGGDARLVEFSGAGHESLRAADPQRWFAAIGALLNGLP